MIDPRIAEALAWVGPVQSRLMVGNRWIGGDSTLASISPSTGETIAEIAEAGSTQVDAAVAAGRTALAGEWGVALPVQRARAMLRLADLIEANVAHIAALEAADGVRPFAEALYGDIPAGAMIVRHLAGLAGSIAGSIEYPSIGYGAPGATVRALVDKRAAGVVAAIVPWNYPFVMACARVAPALAAGCPVILKPAEDTSLSALALAKLVIEAGFPDGAVAVLTGRGSETGAALVRHPDVAMVTFTGSTRVGREIGEVCGRMFKKQSLELGGKCAAIVMDDADVSAAAAGLAGSAFGNAGQTCVASARILVHRSIHDQLVEGLVVASRKLRIGGTLDADATLGPIVNATQHARVSALLDDAAQQGAELSSAHAADGPGFYLNPVVVSGMPLSARLAQEETFGPAVVVEPFDDLDDALSRANATPFGLAGSIWTQRWRDADRASQRLEVGTVYVNCHAWADPAVPMGAAKASGIGLQSGRAGLEGYLTSKITLAQLI